MGFWPKLALSLLGGAALLSLGAWGGYTFRDARCVARDAAYALQESEARRNDSEARMAATVSSMAKFLTAREAVRTVTKTIVEKVPVYVSAKADSGCTLTRGYVRLHDAAASGDALSEPAPVDNDAPSGIALSTAAAVQAENYGLCHENAEQLKSLQDWIKAQLALNPPK